MMWSWISDTEMGPERGDQGETPNQGVQGETRDAQNECDREIEDAAERILEQAAQPHLTPEEREREWLKTLPLPGVPKSDAERRKLWRQLPQKVRVAIRRLHRQFNQTAPKTLVAILKAGGASKEFIEAAKLAKCDSCVKTSGKPRPHPVGLDHGEYRVGDVLGVDVLETADSGKQKYQCVNLVDMESGFQQLEVLRPVGEHAGPPSAESCLEAVHRWVTWLGLPRVLMADRGSHNRGIFNTWASEKGVDIRYAATEAPWMIGKVERHGGLAKAVIRKAVHEVGTTGISEIRALVQEVVGVKNVMMNTSGYSPMQWVTGRNPRDPGALTDEHGWLDLGAMESKHDGSSEFQHGNRHA